MPPLSQRLKLDNSFARLDDAFYTRIRPTSLQGSFLLHANPAAAQLIGLTTEDLKSDAFAKYFSGKEMMQGMEPLAMVYSGHQFGVYSPQLGDGRGLLLGETVHNQQRWDIHLKGSGRTPYSRFGDGRAVLRSTIREYLGSEALHGLGIASTRALALFGSDEPVYRERPETGALLVRLARSHVRFGHFEYFHYTRQPDKVRQLADHLIANHFPEWQKQPDKYEQLLQVIVTNTAETIAKWQTVGFTHGVMNTDNMSILGDTFDYGPYGFMDNYQADFVCNHSDEEGRYAFNQQPGIGLWNLNALAQALSSLLETEQLRDALQRYQPLLIQHYSEIMRQKLGLRLNLAGDSTLLEDWLTLLENNQADFTLSFRALCLFDEHQEQSPLRDQFSDRQGFDQWAAQYRQRLQRESTPQTERQNQMTRVNAKYILRNHLAQQAIEAAEQTQSHTEIDSLLQVLSAPFDEHPQHEHYAKPPPASQRGLALSCSS